MTYLTSSVGMPTWLMVAIGVIIVAAFFVLIKKNWELNVKNNGISKNIQDTINNSRKESEENAKKIIDYEIKLGRADQQQKFLGVMIEHFIDKFADSKADFHSLPDGEYRFLGIYQHSSYLSSVNEANHYILDLPNGWNMADHVTNGEVIIKNSQGLFKTPQPFYRHEQTEKFSGQELKVAAVQ